MKKRLLAILLSVAMVVCLMPTMAFATTEEPAPAEETTVEEVKEEAPVVEEPVVEEETPAEEVVEETPAATEETPVEEAKATLEEETAELEAKETEPTALGTWSGYQYKLTDKNTAAVAMIIGIPGGDIEVSPSAVTKKTVEIQDGVVDVTNEVNDVFANAHTCIVAIIETAQEDSVLNYADTNISVAAFLKIDTTVSVDSAAKKDTTFNYGIDSYLNLAYTQKNGDYYDALQKKYKKDNTGLIFHEINRASIKRESKGATLIGSGSGCELVKDTIVLEKGDKSVDDYLVLRVNADYLQVMYSRDVIGDSVKVDTTKKQTIGLVIGEEGNNGGYATSKALYVGTANPALVTTVKQVMTFFGMGESDAPETPAITVPENLMAWKSFSSEKKLNAYVKGLNGTLKSLTKDNYMAALNSLKADFTETEISFTADTRVKKGVQTGDSNELGLWIALGMLASVAAAGYALKRREN